MRLFASTCLFKTLQTSKDLSLKSRHKIKSCSKLFTRPGHKSNSQFSEDTFQKIRLPLVLQSIWIWFYTQRSKSKSKTKPWEMSIQTKTSIMIMELFRLSHKMNSLKHQWTQSPLCEMLWEKSKEDPVWNLTNKSTWKVLRSGQSMRLLNDM